ncbi:MAG: hypothetical protein LWX83_12365 [Anaerolineae bacterium]|nr:hypothetical protein [Anaerolineae bacterium]
MTDRIEQFNQISRQIIELVPDSKNVYLVGGAVRDLLLNHDIYDWDFTVETDARPLARQVANQLGGAYYLLDEERKTARVLVDWQNRKLVMDFATIRGQNIAEDLTERDCH